MALSEDQKKHLLIGGGLGALAVFLGSMILGDRKAYAGHRLPGGHEGRGDEHDHHEHRKKRRRAEGENDRGEYGGKKKHHHKEHGHGG